MVIATAPEVPRNRDTHYPYRHDSYFYWLTGFNEPEAVRGAGRRRFTAPHPVLPREERGTGDLGWFPLRSGGGPRRLRFRRILRLRRAGCGIAQVAGQPADARLPHRPRHGLGHAGDGLAQRRACQGAQRRARAQRMVDARIWLDEMRLVKDAHELALMRRAAEISTGAHRRRHARDPPGPTRIRDRGGAAVRVPPRRCRGAGLHLHRRRRRQRLRAALRLQQPADARRRPAADRRRLPSSAAMRPTSPAPFR